MDVKKVRFLAIQGIVFQWNNRKPEKKNITRLGVNTKCQCADIDWNEHISRKKERKKIKEPLWTTRLPTI